MFKKKWSKEECRDRYVQGERIGIRALAKEANRSLSTVGRWCAEEDWQEQRDRYRITLRSETQQKIIEKTSDAVSDDLSKRNQQHVLGFEIFRKLSLEFPVAIKQGDEDKKRRMRDDAIAFQRYAAVYANCVMGERTALDMDLMNIDTAIARVIQDGFEVTEPEN